MTDQRDPWNPTSADLRFAADVLHGCVGDVEFTEAGIPTSDPVGECIEMLHHDADQMDAEELARNVFPHLDADGLTRVTKVFIDTIRVVRARASAEDAS